MSQQARAPTLFDLTQSVLEQKCQWYAGESFVLHQDRKGLAFLKEDDYYIHLWVRANGRCGPSIEVAVLDPIQGWIPLKSFDRQRYKEWVARTRKLLSI